MRTKCNDTNIGRSHDVSIALCANLKINKLNVCLNHARTCIYQCAQEGNWTSSFYLQGSQYTGRITNLNITTKTIKTFERKRKYKSP